ncbi:antitoxin family protein [Nodosilinea sp. PGN35]|uniref:antitoxin family protein n=1 Tax=Nodosilinea sp. PGN35 TaxID=3020489 RepID=UPI0023B33ABE|nr:antitoxin family protein [Nodosilinea sp. TSF1-S3]MDF0368080.1 antitoxin family protein [Nodosilinea sp. TSF1-S3]
MQQVVEAVYENGVLRPLATLKLSEGQEVQLIIRSVDELAPDEMLQLAAEVYEGLSETEIGDIEHIAFDRQHFFGEDRK